MITKTIAFPNLGGIEINFYIGRNAGENVKLIESARGHHIWFHVADHPSGHVIAAVPENIKRQDIRHVIKQGAILCKSWSKFSNVKKVKIIYANVDMVELGETEGTVLLSETKEIII